MDALLNSKIGRELKDYVAITLGIMCYALGWAAFLLPYQISTGGVTGISARGPQGPALVASGKASPHASSSAAFRNSSPADAGA